MRARCVVCSLAVICRLLALLLSRLGYGPICAPLGCRLSASRRFNGLVVNALCSDSPGKEYNSLVAGAPPSFALTPRLNELRVLWLQLLRQTLPCNRLRFASSCFQMSAMCATFCFIILVSQHLTLCAACRQGLVAGEQLEHVLPLPARGALHGRHHW